ncbi:MAG: cohesin domain-containing protein, partial [Candidatus Azambacteria bacterium]|nr:cohesin domain-containing protein [Candidatus Azambacteria bacterium]
MISIPLFAFAQTTSATIGGSSATATLVLSPASGSYATGDIFSVNILLNTQGSPIQGVDIVYLKYNPAFLEVQDDEGGSVGVQITSGTLMATTAINSVDTSAGKIAFSQVTTSGTSYTGSGTLATARFKALTSGTAVVAFDFILGSTIDTNVASGGEDILASVTNGSYSISGTAVPPQQDSTAPVRTSGAPSGVLAVGTTQATLSLSTNENATCKYGIAVGVTYASVANTFSTTGGTAHSATVSGLSNGNSYAYYVRCEDGAGNMNDDDHTIAFSVAPSVSTPTPTPTPTPTVTTGGSYIPPTVTPTPSPTITQSPVPTMATVQQTPGANAYLPAGVVEGDLVRGPDGIKVYIVNFYGYKRHIFNPAVFSMYGHFRWDNIKSLNQQEIDALKISNLYRADGDTRVFSLHEVDETKGLAQKRWLSVSAEKFSALGYAWEQVFIINTKERDYYQEGSPITDSVQPQAPIVSIASGALVKSANDPTVYYITATGLKKRIVNAMVFNSYAANHWENITIVEQNALDAYPTVDTIKLSGSAKVYLLESNTKRWIKTAAAF